MMKINLNTRNQLLEIAKNAGAAILEIYESDDFDVSSKDDNSPLTRADQAANKVICDGLEKLEVQYPIISEENKLVDYEVRKKYDRFWLVDPLDGTKEFIKRNGEFTVNIALIENGRTVFGVVYTPVVDELYWAGKGEGAFFIKEDETIKLQANEYKTTDKGLRLVCSRSHLNEETKAFVDNYSEPELVSKGSSLKFLILAKGEADIYPRIAPTMEWDTGAAQIILEEAGGSVTVYNSTQPLEYNKEILRNPYFVAKGAEK